MNWRFNKRKQIKLLDNIYRLTVAGLQQRDIANQIASYGSSLEQLIAIEILDGIGKGKGFSIGLKEWIDTLSWQALVAGERAGDFEGGVKNALITLRTRSASTVLIARALAKPILGVSIMLAVSAGIAIKIIPQFGGFVPMNRWDSLTIIAYQFGLFWYEWGMLLGGGLVAILIGVSISLPLLTGQIRVSLNNFPIYRQFRLIQTSSLLYSLGNLMKANYGLLDSLTTIQENASPFLNEHLIQMISNVHSGRKNLGDILNTGLLNESEQSTLKLLGEIGSFDITLLRSADMHHAMITDEIELIQSFGSDLLKITGACIGMLMASGIAMLIIGIATNLRF